jgi:hypothetical protein
LQIGAIIAGVLTVGPNSSRFRFSAEVVRREAETIALQFVNLSPSLHQALAAANS